jgi:hypothetical protein
MKTNEHWSAKICTCDHGKICDNCKERKAVEYICRVCQRAITSTDVVKGKGFPGMHAECYDRYDDPETDATDAAHPAWWRGNHSGSLGVTRALAKILKDGKIGVFAHPEVEDLALKIDELRKHAQRT